ncbi:MAG: hypothetical protein IKA79_01600, partial [Lentisphaeria bacterium]|nr:hypothetical protein [Lentisphaeria bacterium]
MDGVSNMQKNVMYLFLFVLLTGSLFLNGVEKPPVADILLTGNLQGRPSKTLLSYIHAHNPYSIWVIGGNALDGKKAMEQNKGTEHGTYLKADRSFLRSLYFANPCLAVPGNEDFLYGLHGCVASFRALRPAGAYVLDYIGARNNENPFLLKYVDILVNGKTLRFMALGAWEKLYPAQKDVPYRRITEEV